MGSAVHQVASASVAAVFSIAMLLAAHLFCEYRFSRMQATLLAQAPAATSFALSRLPFKPDVASIPDHWSDGGF